MAGLSGKTILIASNNQGKALEIKELLSKLGVQVKSVSEVIKNVVEPEETGTTFIANAQLKAEYYGKIANMPALADDSGLCVDALGGDPGIFSARWAGESKDFSIAMKKIEDKLNPNNDKSARFVCALSLYDPINESFINVEGIVEGALTFPARGEKGFGYDPIFIANGYDKTFAEIDPDEKKFISHRSDAFKKLLHKLA